MTTTQQDTTKKVEIEFMFIDLEVCTRCKGTDANLDMALQTVQNVLESAGAEVTVRKTLVDSENTALGMGLSLRRPSGLMDGTLRWNCGRAVAIPAVRPAAADRLTAEFGFIRARNIRSPQCR